MIKVTDTVTPSPEQWMAAIQGMRNPMNSWDKIDSYTGFDCNTCGKIKRDGFCEHGEPERESCYDYYGIEIGKNDYDLMKRLTLAGTEHSKFLRMLPVIMIIDAPLYWWKEFDTYKVGTVANSCSTMHKIHAKEFTLDDFSHEHLNPLSINILTNTIKHLNTERLIYIESKNKSDWWQMIQLLPSSYNQKRIIFLNYAVLANIYHQRKGHKLDEWHNFCDAIEKLPYSEFITKNFVQNEN